MSLFYSPIYPAKRAGYGCRCRQRHQLPGRDLERDCHRSQAQAEPLLVHNTGRIAAEDRAGGQWAADPQRLVKSGETAAGSVAAGRDPARVASRAGEANHPPVAVLADANPRPPPATAPAMTEWLRPNRSVRPGWICEMADYSAKAAINSSSCSLDRLEAISSKS